MNEITISFIISYLSYSFLSFFNMVLFVNEVQFKTQIYILEVIC